MTVFCYQHHINDWRTDTAGLSLEQRGAYREMMDWYYALEGKLPSDVKKIHRLVGAQTRREKEAVNFICAKFWQKNADFLSQKRSETELLRIKEKQKKASISAKNRHLASANAHANAHANALLTKNQEPITNNSNIPKKDRVVVERANASRSSAAAISIFEWNVEELQELKSLVAENQKIRIGNNWQLPNDWGKECERLGFTSGRIVMEIAKFRAAYTIGKNAGRVQTLRRWANSWLKWMEIVRTNEEENDGLRK